MFDGIFYHLWYLPALLVGLYMTFFMYKRMSMNALLAAAGLLYVLGLLGGGYYGLIADNNGISQVYDGIFTLFDNTRNGLFYAPVYLVLGAWAARRPQPAGSAMKNAGLFLASLGFMLAEGILLSSAGIPRQDGMYIFALPAAYFLFQWAREWKGRSGKAFREWRVWVYILHPYAIVFVHAAIQADNLEDLFIANSLFHFLAVCLLSIAMAAAAGRISLIKISIPSLGKQKTNTTH
ncbi:acyltransferase family protein [Paenibacillus sepulcri]|uniref:acyltransferase family protein n=1 Tax=Paenibacillus sepulcri TaxID=359917 RepID=UPI0036213D9A